MSLHALAQDMSSKGRFGDSMLVHMSPNEVAGLHALALAHGEKLTINPETGLPEAFSLKKLLPAVLGFALNTFAPGLGTAVGSMFGAGAAAGTAALVGAGFGLAKGSLKEGLLAGLGAYGGAGLAQGLAASGANQIASEEVLRQQAGQLPLEGTSAAENFLSTPSAQATGTTGSTTTIADATGSASPVAEVVIEPVNTYTPMPVAEQAATAGFQGGAGYTPPTGLESLRRGAQSIYDQGRIGDFAKLNKNNLYAIGASAMLSPEDEEGVPETRRDGYIRPARYDWRTGKYEYFEPVKASEWGTRNLSEYTSASDPRARTPIGAKAGGLMALAGGGAIAFDDGGFVVGGGGPMSDAERQRLIDLKAKEDADAAAKLKAYTPSDPILAPMLAAGVKGMLHGETDEQAYNRIKQMDMERTEKRAARDAWRAQMGPDDVVIDGVLYRGGLGGGGGGGGGGGTTPGPTTPGPTTPGPTTPGPTNPPPYTPPPGPYNPPPPMPTTPDIKDVTTGGSRAAYEYLYGQGAYPTTPYLPEGTKIAKPYWESVGLADPYKGPKVADELKNPNAVPKTAPPTGQKWVWNPTDRKWVTEAILTPVPSSEPPAGANGGMVRHMALGGLGALAGGGSASRYNLGDYSDGGRLLKGPGDGVSDNIPATIGGKQPARLADGEFVVPARIVSELGNGSTDAGARKLYAMMDRVQKARGKTTGKNRVAANSRAEKYLPA